MTIPRLVINLYRLQVSRTLKTRKAINGTSNVTNFSPRFVFSSERPHYSLSLFIYLSHIFPLSVIVWHKILFRQTQNVQLYCFEVFRALLKVFLVIWMTSRRVSEPQPAALFVFTSKIRSSKWTVDLMHLHLIHSLFLQLKLKRFQTWDLFI